MATLIVYSLASFTQLEFKKTSSFMRTPVWFQKSNTPPFTHIEVQASIRILAYVVLKLTRVFPNIISDTFGETYTRVLVLNLYTERFKFRD